MDRIAEIRLRKLARYRELLGQRRPAKFELPISTDLAYATALGRIAALAPPDFALRAGASRRLAELGLLGALIASCTRLGDAYDIWLRHADMAGEPVKLTSTIGAGNCTIELAPLPYLPRAVVEFCSEELCATFFAFVREITGQSLGDFATEFAHERRPAVEYESWLPGPVSFGHRVTRLRGPANALEMPHLSRDPETFEHLRRHFEGESERMKRFALRPVSLRLYDHLLRRLGNVPSLDDAAAAMGMSTRSLVRRLQREGTSFGEVLDEFRRNYALEFLRDTLASPKQIAYALGYVSENSLRRSFRGWTGQPIGRWRRALNSRA